MVDERDILVSGDIISEPERLRSILARGVDAALQGGVEGGGEARVVRLVVRLMPFDPHDWLAAQDLMPRIYWHGRNDDWSTAAVGSADRAYGDYGADFDSLRSQLDVVLPGSDARVRYFGGFRFDAAAEADKDWKEFGTFSFTLPRFVLMRGAERSMLACNLLLPRDTRRRQEILDEIGRLRFPVRTRPEALPLPLSRSDEPQRSAWARSVAWALDAFGDEETALKKVVLARRVVFGFPESLDPIAILRQLEADTENCFHFGFQFSEGAAFIGATPERLFRRSGRRVWTEALAGTRPRGGTEAEDRQAVGSMLASDKVRREHGYVRESIRQALDPLCDEFSMAGKPTGLRLARGWHLVSRSRGLLKEGVHGSEVMRALHPTPAVGGHPTGRALQAIRQRERFDRGWYAGPIGWIGSHGAEFAVALRCGLVRHHTLSLYSGAGIVDGSDPEAEWAEIEQKIGDFVKVFGLS